MIKCTIVSVLDKRIEDNCEGIFLETITGQRGILVDHIPIISELKENSLIRLKKESKEIKFILGQHSFLQFKNNECLILTRSFTEAQTY